jgi:hypothetical protein
VSTFSLQNFSAMMAARLTREVVLALDLTYATVETNSVSSDRFEILHSKVSGISPRMTLSYCSLSTKTSFFCPSLGLLVDHVYSLSYVDNTTLGLKKLDDIMAHIGVAYRLGLGPRLFTTTQLSYERGIGLLNSEQTRWVKHENIKGSVTLSIPLNRALLLAFGGIVNFRNSAYSINADQWSQRETAFGGLVGFTYLLGAGPVPKIHARQPVKPAPPVTPRAPAAIPF